MDLWYSFLVDMKALWRIISFTRNLWPYYLLTTFLSILVALLAQSVPLITGAVIREIEVLGTSEFNANWVWILVGLMFAQDLVSNLASNVQGYYGDILAAKMQKYMSEEYYAHLMSLPQEYFDMELSGKITARLNRSVVQISNFMQVVANNFSSFILTAIISLGIVAYISPIVAFLLGMLYPMFVWLTVRTSGRWMEYQGKKNENQDVAFGRFQEVISQIKVIKSFVRERSELQFFEKHMGRVLGITYPQSKLWHTRDVERKMMLNVIMGLVFAIIVLQTVTGQIGLVEAVMLIQFSTLIRFPIFTISFLVENVQRAVADSKDYFEAMELKPAIVDEEGAKELKVREGAVEFDNVVFGYDSQDVLRGMSFEISPGSKVALVGESGEGKSTIASLILRLYEPSAGRILIDGEDIAKVKQASLRENIGMVFQEASLFSGTIAENITYGAPGAGKDEIEDAAKAANAAEFISKFEAGYETLIGERGLKLSGGQKQRIAIARAILKNAPILILDEATSSLDNKSEFLVQEALERLMKGKTTIIIAHRLSTIANVDQIVTLRDGNVGEIGTPEELTKSGGIYSRLLEVQTATSTEERKKVLAKYGIVG